MQLWEINVSAAEDKMENSPLYKVLPIMVLLFVHRSDRLVHVYLEQDVSTHKVSTYLCLHPFLDVNTRLTSATLAQMNNIMECDLFGKCKKR